MNRHAFSLGERLRQERVRIGYSQRAFAYQLDRSLQGYVKVEHGLATPKVDLLANAARFGIDVQYVVTGVRSTNLAEVAAVIGYHPTDELPADGSVGQEYLYVPVLVVAASVADESSDDGQREFVDRLPLKLHGDAGEGHVFHAVDEPVFELVEVANPTRYDKLLQQGPRYAVESALRHRVDLSFRHGRQVLISLDIPFTDAGLYEDCTKNIFGWFAI